MRKIFPVILSLSLLLASSCARYQAETSMEPLFHFHTEYGWLGGIGGLVYDNGTYHIFTEFSEDKNSYDKLGWAHASSNDLINWSSEGIVLSSDKGASLNSGCVVADTSNTSGLAMNGEYPLIAYYSDSEGMIGMAVSWNKGHTWRQQDEFSIPSMDEQKPYSPSIIWDDIHGRWIMSMTSGNSILFYSSSDCRNWKFESVFNDDKAGKNPQWGSSELVKMSDGTKYGSWVLFINMPGGPANGSTATQYFVGDFDGKTFTKGQETELWLDYGKDCNDVRIFRTGKGPISIGWMNNIEYAFARASVCNTMSLTIPKLLTLREEGSHSLVHSHPEAAFSKLATETKDFGTIKIDNADSANFEIPNYKEAFSISASFDFGQQFALWQAQRFGITLSTKDKETVTIGYDNLGRYYYLDRSGLACEYLSSATGQIMGAKYTPKSYDSKWFILVDGDSMEFYSDNGAVNITSLCPTKKRFTNAVLFAENGSVKCKELLFNIYSDI